MDQGLKLFLKKEGMVRTKQGESLINPVRNRISPATQKQAPNQSREQSSEQAQKQTPEQFLNLFHRETKLKKKVCWSIHLLHDNGSIKILTPLIKFFLTLILGSKQDLNLRIFVLSMLFSLILSLKM